MGLTNNRHLLLTVLEAGKPKIKVWADLAPGDSSFPGVQTMVVFLLSPHVQSMQALASFRLLGTPIPAVGYTLVASCEPHYHPKTSTPNTITLSVRVSTY